MRKIYPWLLPSVLLMAGLILIWVSLRQQPPPGRGTLQPVLSPNPTRSLGKRTKYRSCAAQGKMPDSLCTPGDVMTGVSVQEICRSGYAKSVRAVPAELKQEVYAEYGIRSHYSGEYEIDHLIPLELGGSNDIANLWPEPATPNPGFHEKDRVEDFLHQQVCQNGMLLTEAQMEIASDWLKVFDKIK